MKSIFYSMEFTNGFRRYFFFFMILLYFIYLGHSAVAATAMFAVSRIVLTIFELPTGAFADYFSRKTSIIISFILMTISHIGFFVFTNFWLLSLAYILSDIGWSFQSGTNTAWIIDTLKLGKNKQKLSNLFAKFYFYEKVGSIVAALIGFIVIAINFRYVWLIIAVLNFIMVFVVILYMEERNFRVRKDKNFMMSTVSQVKQSISYLFKNTHKQLLQFFIGVFIAALSIEIFTTIIPLIFSQQLLISNSNISGIYTAVNIVALIAPFLGAMLLQKYGFQRPITFGLILLSILMIFFGYSMHLIVSIVLFLAYTVFSLSFATIHDAGMQYIIPSHSRASLGSAINIVWAIANAFASGFVSIGLLTLGLPLIALVAAVIAIAASFVYYAALRTI
jgi:MFS family permease